MRAHRARLGVGPAPVADQPRGDGSAGVLLRRNAIIVFACIEIMTNAANLVLVAMADAWNQPDGRIFVFFVIIVAAAEAAVGLGIVMALYRLHGTVDIDRPSMMRG